MTVSRPTAVLLGLAVLGALVAGCGPSTPSAAGAPTSPAATVTSDPATETVAADPTGPSTTGPAPIAAKPATSPQPATTPKPAARTTTTRRPSPKPKSTTRKPTPKPRATTRPPSTRPVVHPGAFCSPVGALGVTSKGTPMRCTRKAGEDRARWRAA